MSPDPRTQLRFMTMWLVSLLAIGCTGVDSPMPELEQEARGFARPRPHPDRVDEGAGSPGGEWTGAVALLQIGGTFDYPILATAPAGDPRLFVVERTGKIKIVSNNITRVFLDIGPSGLDLIDTADGEGNPNKGLQGLAFHPDFLDPADPDHGRFFIHYATRVGADVQISEFRVWAGDPNAADPASKRDLLNVPFELHTHHGGTLAFGPVEGGRRYLYAAIGDNSNIGSPDMKAQDLGLLTGKLLRIDVDGAAPYAVPPDNPFEIDGQSDTRGEIWVYGLRNPWRFSFDRQTGDLYLPDVGRSSIEEINVLAAGSAGGVNFGWPNCEGTSNGPGYTCDAASTKPVYQYNRNAPSGRCAVIGGQVYRGSLLAPVYSGQFFFGDHCTGEVARFQWDGTGTTTTLAAATPLASVADIHTYADSSSNISSLGVDGYGEIYVLTYHFPETNPVGYVYKLVRAP